jgi:hypothetical protein
METALTGPPLAFTGPDFYQPAGRAFSPHLRKLPPQLGNIFRSGPGLERTEFESRKKFIHFCLNCRRRRLFSGA